VEGFRIKHLHIMSDKKYLMHWMVIEGVLGNIFY
jgi:hypothetical protein